MLAFWIGVAGVAALLLTPAETLPHARLWDKLEHVGAFAALALLGVFAFPERRHAWPLAGGLLVLGVCGELLQAWVPGRESSVADGVANALGVSAVMLLRALRRRIFRRATGELPAEVEAEI